MSNLLLNLANTNNVELCIDEKCLTTLPVTSNNSSLSYKIEYPSGYEVLPLAGGAVVSIDISGLKLVSNKSKEKALENILSDIVKFNATKSISGLNNLHTEINDYLFNIASRDYRYFEDGDKSPSIYISRYLGSNPEEINSTSVSSDLYRISEFKYIPFQVFKIIFKNLFGSSTASSRNQEFLSTTGISGRTFEYLNSKIKSDNISDSDAIDFALEFFPVGILSGDEILSTDNKPKDSGYYTIQNNKVWMKIPDISGGDSAGSSKDFRLKDYRDFLFFEFYYNSTPTRLRINKFKAPPVAYLIGGEFADLPVFSGSESVASEVDIRISLDEQEDVKAYLSPIILKRDLPDTTVGRYKGFDNFDTLIEVYSSPDIGQSIEPGRNPIVSDPILKFKLNENSLKYVPILSRTTASLSVPFIKYNDPEAFFRGIDRYSFFGLKNRADILLSDDGFVKNRNESKYYKLSNAGKIPLLSANMPRITLSDNPAWIEEVSSQQEMGNVYSKKYSAMSFAGIDLDSFSGVLSYQLYIKDEIGQISKVNNGKISFIKPLPKLESVYPTGFDGDIPIIYGQNTTLVFRGENISCVTSITIYPEQGDPVTFLPSTRPDFIQINDDGVILNLIPADFFNNFQNTSQRYRVSIDCEGFSTEPLFIYFCISEFEKRPGKPSDPVKFEVDDFESSDFGTKPIVGVPVFKDENNAKIFLKTKRRIFRSDSNIYAYIGIPSDNPRARSIIQHFSSPDRIYTLSGNNLNLLCPIDISYLLSNSPSDDFYKIPISNKEIVLKFPGSKYSKYNFSVLQDLEKAYIIITNKSLVEVGAISLNLDGIKSSDSDFSYATVEMGNLTGTSGIRGPAFIEPAGILGIMAKDVNNDTATFKSTFSVNQFALDSLRESLDDKALELSPGVISLSKKIKDLVLIVSGVEESRISSRYRFFIEDQEITNKRSRSPKFVPPNKLLFYFKNVVPETDGILTFSTLKDYPIFDVSGYKNDKYIAKGTAIAKSGTYQLDRELNRIVLASDITQSGGKPLSNISEFLSGEAASGIIGFENANLIDSLYPGSRFNGLIFDVTNQKSELYKTYLPIDISPEKDIKLKVDKDGGDFTEQILYSDVPSTEISLIDKNTLAIPSLTTFNFGEYIEATDRTYSLLFFGAQNYKHPSIKFNVGEFKSVWPPNSGNPVTFDEADFKISSGDEIRLLVVNTNRYFDILLNGERVDLVGRPVPYENGYLITFTVPKGYENIDFDGCLRLCASTSNPERSRLGGVFGPAPNTPDGLENYGDSTDRVTDPERVEDAEGDSPSIVPNYSLPIPPINLKLVRSFCDISLAMVGELKFFLNGFRTLMIPVKIIFAIIDVLCSLINPVKIAKALLRLLESLYELILLIPYISVPFMFIKLLLHMLKALECVFEKIVSLSAAIVEIWNDINNIVNNFKVGPMTGLKSLEDTLTNYLNDFDLELKFLDPIVSILAIFIELLQINFKFPCTVINEDSPEECSIDGSVLSGIVSGIVAPDLEILTQYTLPVCQSYSTSEDGSTTSLSEPADGNLVADRDENTTWLESLSINPDSLRAESGLDFNPTMAPTYTKNKKKSGGKNIATFYFNSRAESTTLNSKNIDPNQSLDAPLKLLRLDGNSIKAANFGNIISPIDGLEFLNVNLETSTASVKPLVISYEIPQYQTNPTTGAQEEVGVTTATRTINDIPMMVLLDDELNLYFIEPDGIKYDANGNVYEIVAKIQNLESIRKNRFLKEEVELEDGSQINLYDFPQLYFFDMRQAGSQIDQLLQTCALNSYPYNANNANDILDIVQSQKLCIENWANKGREFSNSIRSQINSGVITNPNIKNDSIALLNKELELCTIKSFDDTCKFVVSSLNTSFKVLEDSDPTPNPEYVGETIDENSIGGFVPNPPPLTGAREYAAGIGDSASVNTGSIANIEIIPRDYYDGIIVANFLNKISLEIIQDATGSANFIKNLDGEIIFRNGSSYIAKLTSMGVGEVKVKASICGQTIQALTYNFDEPIVPENNSNDCVPNIGNVTAAGGIGGLLRVDRVLSIFFTEPPAKALAKELSLNDESIITNPQEFGTKLEN